MNQDSYNDAKARTVEHLHRYLNKNIQIVPRVYIIYNWIMLWPKLTKRIFYQIKISRINYSLRLATAREFGLLIFPETTQVSLENYDVNFCHFSITFRFK